MGLPSIYNTHERHSMGHVNPVKLAASVATGGLSTIAEKAVNTVTGKGSVLNNLKAGAAAFGPFGSASQPTLGTNKTLLAEGAAAAAAGGAAALSTAPGAATEGAAAGSTLGSTGAAPAATAGGTAGAMGEDVAAAQSLPGAAASTAAPATKAGVTAADVLAGTAVAGTALTGIKSMQKVSMPGMPGGLDQPSLDTATQSAAQADNTEQETARRKKAVLDTVQTTPGGVSSSPTIQRSVLSALGSNS